MRKGAIAAPLGALAVVGARFFVPAAIAAPLPAGTDSVKISETVSTNGDPGDWVELVNMGFEPVDLGGFIFKDADDTHTYVIPDATVIQPGDYLVLDEADFGFGLGKNDSARLFTPDGTLLDELNWDGMGHAPTSYVRDASGAIVASAEVTKGAANLLPVVKPVVVINEIVYDDVVPGTADAIELYNAGDVPADLTGWSVHDDKDRPGEGNLSGTLEPGEYLVLTKDVDFAFGLGKGDSVRLWDAAGVEVDAYAYTADAPLADWSRCPDGTGEFQHGGEITLGAANNCDPVVTEEPTEPAPTAGGVVVINEVDSSPADYVEFYNPGADPIDLSGYEVRDNSDDHRWRFPAGTILEPGAYLIVDGKSPGQIFNESTQAWEENTFEGAIGVGSADSIRLYDTALNEIDSFTWTEHANIDGDEASATLARCPDGVGPFGLAYATLGGANECIKPTITINEIESNGDTTDWAEIINTGKSSVDISGWTLMDSDAIGHASDTIPLPDGTVLNPGEYFVFDESTHFNFGLGKEDSVVIRDAAGNIVAQETWVGHASGVLARCPDGEGPLVDVEVSTKGAANACGNPVVLNEVGADANGSWIELYNPTDGPLDVSGLVFKDQADNVYVIPAGTTIEPGAYLVIPESDFGFSLAGANGIRLLDGGLMIDSAEWTELTPESFGRCPDITGDFEQTRKATPGAVNSCVGIPDVIDFIGEDDPTALDETAMFLGDSSGLDYVDGILWGIDNDASTIWKLIVNPDGTVTPAEGWEDGKRARFQKDAGNPDMAGPDGEGISMGQNGLLYVAVERDNNDKGTNYNVILEVDPNDPADGNDIVASREWNLTALLPQVAANTGIEAVEAVPMSELAGKLWDSAAGAPLDPANYPNAVADSVFFVALEDDGFAYAFVLGDDGSATPIGAIDSKIGGAMALNYDPLTGKLFIMADDGYDGRFALVAFNGTEEPEVVHMNRPAGMPNVNNEGFALADQCVDGQRPAWFFEDGAEQNALRMVMVACDMPVEDPVEDPVEPTEPAPAGDAPVDTMDDTPAGDAPADTAQPKKPAQQGLAWTGASSAGLIMLAVLLVGAGMLVRRQDELAR